MNEEQVVELIELHQAALGKAAGELDAHAQAGAKAAARVAPVVDVLVEHRLLPLNLKEAALGALGTHEGALAVLENLGRRCVLAKSAEAAPAAIGSPEPATKSAGNGKATVVSGTADRRFVEQMLALRNR